MLAENLDGGGKVTKRCIIRYRGGFNDGQILDSSNGQNSVNIQFLLAATNRGQIGKQISAANPAALQDLVATEGHDGKGTVQCYIYKITHRNETEDKLEIVATFVGHEVFEEFLRPYFLRIAEALRSDAGAAAIFPNSGDKGTSRERVYAQFLKNHLPSACNVQFGGNVFNEFGLMSKQVDIIVTNDTCPQFNHLNPDGTGKTAACVDGTLAVISIKSSLTSKEIKDALANLASIPQHQPFTYRNLGVDAQIDQWPYKVVFAFDGIGVDSIKKAMAEFSADNPKVPLNRLPDMVHVLGKYRICKYGRDLVHDGHTFKAGNYATFTVDPDIAAMVSMISNIQEMLWISKKLPYFYGDMFARLCGMVPNRITQLDR